jgi:hypothetical protein
MATGWEEIGQDRMADVPGLALFVGDGTSGRYHDLATVPPAAALADYAARYVSDGPRTVSWHLYMDGKEAYSGWHTFGAEC